MEGGFDHLNLHRLAEFIDSSRLARKLMGLKPAAAEAPSVLGGLQSLLASRNNNKTAPVPAPAVQEMDPSIGGSPLMAIADLLRSLGNPSDDGRLIVSRRIVPSQGGIKYLVLNPANLFRDLVTEPRSVVVAGGTMQPFFEFECQLFRAAGAERERVTTFSCGHVIPKEHVLSIALTRGPSNKELDFSWANRSNLLDELFSLGGDRDWALIGAGVGAVGGAVTAPRFRGASSASCRRTSLRRRW